jgi:hypothetical protein
MQKLEKESQELGRQHYLIWYSSKHSKTKKRMKMNAQQENGAHQGESLACPAQFEHATYALEAVKMS